MKRLLILAGALLLSSCGGPSEELQQWMADVKKEVRPHIEKISEPKTFEPFVYKAQDQTDPFDPIKVANALRKLAAKSSNGLQPDQDRRKEPLEAYPLDAVAMVGTLEKPGLKYALLRADNAVYQVKIGNYVGQNYGIVSEITDDQVTLKEVVQDAAGEWVNRVSTLQLQESKK